MGFGDAVKACYSNYASFSGRARRREYWFFALYVYIVYAILFGLAFAVAAATESGIAIVLPILWMLGHIVPILAVSVRRLHDTDKSGWFFLLSFVPFGGIVLLVFFCIEGTPGPNQFGPNPKQPTGAAYYAPPGQQWGDAGAGQYLPPGAQPGPPPGQQWGAPPPQQQPGGWGAPPPGQPQQPNQGGYPPPPGF
jgi:uncharacterized membrane protein YhaH (DUF805 family)